MRSPSRLVVHMMCCSTHVTPQQTGAPDTRAKQQCPYNTSGRLPCGLARKPNSHMTRGQQVCIALKNKSRYALAGGEHGGAAARGGHHAHAQAGRSAAPAQRLQGVAQRGWPQPVARHHPAHKRATKPHYKHECAPNTRNGAFARIAFLLCAPSNRHCHAYTRPGANAADAAAVTRHGSSITDLPLLSPCYCRVSH